MQDDFQRRILGAVTLGVGVIAAVAIAWSAIHLLLLIFAAILGAQFLLGLAGGLKRWPGLSHGWALATVCLGLGGLLVLGGVLLAPTVAEQTRSLIDSLPDSLEQARAALHDTRVGAWLGGALPTADELRELAKELATGSTAPMKHLTVALTTALGALGSAVLIAFLALFLAAQPRVYRDGVVRLIPPARRERGREVLGRIGETLRWWLLGKSISMLLVGALSALGLWLLGVPLALALGLLAALLSFIPNFGPVLGLLPAALIALAQGPAMAGYVVLLYAGIQTVESYLITPLIQRRAIALPPALILAAQVIIAGLLGALGLALATPLLAVGVVVVDALHVEGMGDEPGG